MAKFKQDQIYPGVTKTRTNAIKVYCSEAIAAGDIISVIGVQDDFMSVAKADANGAVTLNSSLLYVADYAGASGDYTPLALPWKVVTGINTASGTIGDPVYLSDTAGGVSLTTGSIKVGTVLTVATSGTAIIAPGAMVSTSGTAYGPSTSLIDGSAKNTDFEITQPAGTVLTDIGVVMTTALAGSSGDSVVSVGTSAGGQQICANTDWMSSHTDIPIGTSLQVASAVQGEGGVSLTFVNDSSTGPQYTATARTVHIRIANSAEVTAGVARAYIKFERI